MSNKTLMGLPRVTVKLMPYVFNAILLNYTLALSDTYFGILFDPTLTLIQQNRYLFILSDIFGRIILRHFHYVVTSFNVGGSVSISSDQLSYANRR